MMKKLKTASTFRCNLIALAIILCAFMHMSFTNYAIEGDTSISVFDAITYEEVVKFTITSDFENLKTNRRFQEEQQAALSFKDENDENHEFTVDLSLRGRYRRVFSKDIPPLKIEFKKKELEANGYDKYDDLKLVTYFYEDKKVSKDILLREYLAYKLYNSISGYSYRVQLVELELHDVNTGKKDKQMGFVIEDTDQLRNRIGVKKLTDSIELKKENFHKIQTQIASLFQYMIGNSDWSILPGKNIKLFETKGKIVMVPYDFDFSGMVDAPYAVPDNSKNINSVKDRIFLGFHDSIEEMAPVIKLFERKKDKLLSIVNETKKLSPEGRFEMIEYIEGFYKDIEIRRAQNISLTGAYTTR